MMSLACVLLSVALGQAADLPALLEDPDPQVRLAAAVLARRQQAGSVVGALVRRLEDEDAGVRAAAEESLRRITGKMLAGAAAWNEWWAQAGRREFPRSQVDRAEVEQIALGIAKKETGDLKGDITKSGREVRFMAITMGVAIFLFLGVMIFFVGHVSSKIKGWRELVGRAEIFIRQGQEIADRTDRIVAELDAKKAEMASFLAGQREENEGKMARFGDILERDLEHKVREEVGQLRQKAERELEQIVAELRARLEVDLRRAAAEAKRA